MLLSPDERELLQELWWLSSQLPGFALHLANHEMSVDDEIDFVHQLADIAEALFRHANARRGLTIDGEPLPLVLDAALIPTQPQPRALPPGHEPGCDHS